MSDGCELCGGYHDPYDDDACANFHIEKLEQDLISARMNCARDGKCQQCGKEAVMCWHPTVEEYAEANATILALGNEMSRVTRELAEYSGWSPDQFLRYQEMHKKLQADYVALESANAFLCQERDALKAELERVRLRWRTGKPPFDQWIWTRSRWNWAGVRKLSERDYEIAYVGPDDNFEWAGPLVPPEPQEDNKTK